jgi:hypothetical protein
MPEGWRLSMPGNPFDPKRIWGAIDEMGVVATLAWVVPSNPFDPRESWPRFASPTKARSRTALFFARPARSGADC